MPQREWQEVDRSRWANRPAGCARHPSRQFGRKGPGLFWSCVTRMWSVGGLVKQRSHSRVQTHARVERAKWLSAVRAWGAAPVPCEAHPLSCPPESWPDNGRRSLPVGPFQQSATRDRSDLGRSLVRARTRRSRARHVTEQGEALEHQTKPRSAPERRDVSPAPAAARVGRLESRDDRKMCFAEPDGEQV